MLVYYRPTVKQRRRALLSCACYFLLLMPEWFVTPVGGWKYATPQYLIGVKSLGIKIPMKGTT